MKKLSLISALCSVLGMGWAQSCVPEAESMVPVVDSQNGKPMFWFGRYEVTNDEFAQFVAATGYRTEAELRGSSQALRFDAKGHSDGHWHAQAGVNWMQPHGENAPRWEELRRHPVVHVTLRDALAYAHWKGHDLPTSQEWEQGANQRSATARSLFVAEPRDTQGRPTANYWQGVFPVHHVVEDGYRFTAPVGSFRKEGDNAAQDVVGNVWEITTTAVASGASALLGVPSAQSRNPTQITIKGGSYLCAENYCQNYHTYSSAAHDATLPAMHIGFRTILRSCL